MAQDPAAGRVVRATAHTTPGALERVVLAALARADLRDGIVTGAEAREFYGVTPPDCNWSR